MSSIRRIGAPDPAPASELIPLEEVAERYGVHIDTVRRWIKADLADGKHRVPGARGEGSRYIVLRAPFERAVRDGIEPARSPELPLADVAAIAGDLQELANDLLQRAAALHHLTTATRKAS